MTWFANLPIARKFMLSFASMIAVIIAVSGFTVQTLSSIKTSNGWTIHTYAVIEASRGVMAAMVDQETGAAASQLQQTTDMLGTESSRLNQEVENFLTNVKAA